ncbi:MAG: leucine-rich repeat domain-containing protein [Bacteroides oleiciplenus]|nr:leucine-rich repeat domain-containing protein [Bacteroides oleiciplenus]MBD9090960.1 leucine-rich repeat domain-containing protein [Bacteroides oleiciplenus]
MKRNFRLCLSAAILIMAALATASCTDAAAPLADEPADVPGTPAEDLTGKPIQIGSVVSLAPNDGAETRAIDTDPDFPVEGSTMTVFCFVPTDAMDDKAYSPAARANYIYDGTSSSWQPTNPDAPLCWQSGTLNHFFAAVSPAVDDTEVDFGAGAKAFISTATFYVVYDMVFAPAFSLPVTWTNELYTAWGRVRSTGIDGHCGYYEPKTNTQISLTLCRPLVSIDIISESTKVMLRNAPSATNNTSIGDLESYPILRTMQMLPSDGGLVHRAYTLPYTYSDIGETNISFTTDAGASISNVANKGLIAGSKVMINGQDNTSAVTNSTAGGLGEALKTADPSKKKIVIGGTINDADMSALSTFIKSNSITDVVILADGVTSIGDNAFDGCSSLKSINLPEEVTSIGESAFYGCISLTNISLPDGVTSIGDNAFAQCALISIILPEKLTSIGMATFADCGGLTSINLPKGVTSIEDGAFRGCTSLISISLPDGVTRIGDWAFESCSNLEEISLSGTNDQFELALPTLGGKAFTSTRLNTLYLRSVPPDRFNAANYTTTWDGTNIAWKAIHYYYNGPDDDLYHTDAAYYSGHWPVPTP